MPTLPVHKAVAVALALVPLTASLCRAQACYDPQQYVGPTIQLTPQYYAPGQTYNAILTNPPPQGWFVPADPPVPPWVVPGVFVLTAASMQAGNYTAEDPL